MLNLFRRFRPTPLGKILDPDIDALRRMSPRELMQYKAGWKEGTERWLLADSEQRRREAWSGPVKLSLAFSFVALLFSLIAIVTD